MKLVKFISNVLFLSLFPCDSSINDHNNNAKLNIVFSTIPGGKSHASYLMKILKVLDNRGHSITYATVRDNFEYIGKYNYSLYDLGHIDLRHNGVINENTVDDVIKNFHSFMLKHIGRIVVESYDVTFAKYEQLFESQAVDLIICDFFASPCLDAARKHSIPVISGFQGLDFGIASAPYILEGLDIIDTTTEHMSIHQQIMSFIKKIKLIYTSFPLSLAINKARAKYNLPSSLIPFGSFDKVFKISNTYIGFDDPRPIPTDLRIVGPVIDEDYTPLTTELEEFLNKNRIMYVSFGGTFSLNSRLIQLVLEAIQLAIDENTIDGAIWGLGMISSEDFPETYLAKGKTYSTASLLKGSHNTIKIISYAPQIAILNHPNTALFLSHAGIESVFEAIHTATPILAMPPFADQPRNARLVLNRGIGDFVMPLLTNPLEIHSKIKQLTRPNNVKLKARLSMMQSISKLKNNERESNALFLEHYALSAKICRQYSKPEPFGIPCELEELRDAGKRMPFWKLNILNTALVFFLFSLGFVFLLATIMRITFTRIRSLLFSTDAIDNKKKLN